MGLWGYNLYEAWYKVIVAAGLPLLAATIWGVFAVPGDSSRSGKTVIVTSGIIRLFLELLFFAFAGWAIFYLGYILFAWIFISATLLHYILSYDRIYWLLKH
jgi:hypothetical protein